MITCYDRNFFSSHEATIIHVKVLFHGTATTLCLPAHVKYQTESVQTCLLSCIQLSKLPQRIELRFYCRPSCSYGVTAETLHSSRGESQKLIL